MRAPQKRGPQLRRGRERNTVATATEPVIVRAPTAIGVIGILVGLFGVRTLVGILFQCGPLEMPR
jgi:hypothetical protein